MRKVIALGLVGLLAGTNVLAHESKKFDYVKEIRCPFFISQDLDHRTTIYYSGGLPVQLVTENYLKDITEILKLNLGHVLKLVELQKGRQIQAYECNELFCNDQNDNPINYSDLRKEYLVLAILCNFTFDVTNKQEGTPFCPIM